MTVAFVLLLLAVNTRLFKQPIIESGDYAANSLLVQQAKHFHLLTGHYSRWHFHHPGPAFLYLFALGEFLFYDLLHLVPSPYNAQLVLTILFNGFLLGASLYIFRRYAKLPVALALLVVEIVAVVVNTHGAPSMWISNWMPDVLLFPYLLFAVSAASVMTGETRDLPFLAFSGMLLIHAHFAQFLFVGVIGGGSVLYLLLRAVRQHKLRKCMAERWRHAAIAVAIVAVLAAPPLIELALDRPNNLEAALAYFRQFGDIRYSLGMAIGYFACFLLFIGRPDVALNEGPVGILRLGLSQFAVAVYWIVLLLLAAVAVLWRRSERKRPAPFLVYLACIGCVSVALFLYWGRRITGGFYAFNGEFVYAFHLLAWFLVLGMVAPRLERRVGRKLGALALACILVVAIVERKGLRPDVPSHPEDHEAALAAPRAPFGSLVLTFDQKQWSRATGVANAMKRLNKPFCVYSYWGFLFSNDEVCPDLLTANRLGVADNSVACTLPCRFVYHDARLSLTLGPQQLMSLPVEISPRKTPGVDITGFNETEGSFCWTQKHASLIFWLAPEAGGQHCYRLAVTGRAFPGRPLRVGINGRSLGAISKTAFGTSVLAIPADVLRAGAANSITLDTDNAGPVGQDKRELGFFFSGLVLDSSPSRGCEFQTTAHAPGMDAHDPSPSLR